MKGTPSQFFQSKKGPSLADVAREGREERERKECEREFKKACHMTFGKWQPVAVAVGVAEGCPGGKEKKMRAGFRTPGVALIGRAGFPSVAPGDVTEAEPTRVGVASLRSGR